MDSHRQSGSHLNICITFYVINTNIAWILVDQRLPRSDRG